MIPKKQLIPIIKSAVQEFRDLEGIFSPDELDRKGLLKQWAVKDDVIHCAFYIQQFADRLAWPRDHEKVDGSDYLTVNDHVWEDHQTENWKQSLQMLEDACQAVIAGLEPFSDEEINDPNTLTWLGGRSIAEYIPGLIYVHGVMHIQYAYMRDGKSEEAIASADKSFKLIDGLDTSETGRGSNLYNKACSYALAGHRTEAISLVKEAIKLAPNLLEWSKQDSDLDNLRDDPQFKALYA